MEWMGVLMAAFVMLFIVGPMVILLGSFLLVSVAGFFLPPSPAVGYASFDCPFSRRHVSTQFLSPPGGERPDDVLMCSAFADPRRVTCEKGCTALAETHAVGHPMLPRFSLIADGVAYRVSGS